jgi:hypothetical protein
MRDSSLYLTIHHCKIHHVVPLSTQSLPELSGMLSFIIFPTADFLNNNKYFALNNKV